MADPVTITVYRAGVAVIINEDDFNPEIETRDNLPKLPPLPLKVVKSGEKFFAVRGDDIALDETGYDTEALALKAIKAAGA